MGLSLGGIIGGSALGPFGSIMGSGAGNSLFGTQQGVINTQGSTSPWAPMQPYLTDAFAQGKSLYGQGVNPWISQANTMQANRAMDPNGLTSQAQNLAGNTIAGQYLSPDSNPYLKSSVQDALGLAGSAFAGQFGGNAGSNLGNSGYQEALARGLGATATNAYSNAYGQERQNQQSAMAMAPSLDYANSGALYNAGMQQQQAPWMNLSNYESSLSPGLGFNQTTGQQPYYQNNTATTLGALAGGAAAFKMFSDRRLKSNIVKVGEDPRGFGVYEFDILGNRQRGVMADEVEKVIPGAVSECMGYKVVDYARL